MLRECWKWEHYNDFSKSYELGICKESLWIYDINSCDYKSNWLGYYY